MKICAFDTETTGLLPYNGAKIFAFSITDEKGGTKVYRFDRKDRARDVLTGFFEDVTIIKVCHNLKFDLGFVLSMGIKVMAGSRFHDTMLMSQCLRNDERSHRLDALCIKYGGRDMVYEEDDRVEQWFRQTGSYAKVPVDLMTAYQKADGERTMMLFKTLFPMLQGRGEKAVNDYENEVALAVATIQMEKYGILYDREEAGRLRVRLSADIVQDTVRVKDKYNGCEPINLGSGKQVAHLLYKKMGFAIPAFTNGGEPKTDKDAFLGLHQRTGHEIFDILLRFRSYSKAISMMDGYEENICSDGRLHPNIKTNHAATGRESCENPNLQNVTKEINEKNPFPVSLRTVFRADPRRILLFVDYAGIEMRLIIDATEEPELMTVLKARGDVHRPTMECFVDLPNWTVDGARKSCDDLKERDPKSYKSLRGAFKNTGFCVAYGGSDTKVAFTLGKPFHEVMEGCLRYRRRFSRIANFSTSMSYEAKRNRFITTPFGRRLYVPPDQTYIASNYMIQGTAAGVLKRGQVRLQKFIDNNYKGLINLVLPIHDELVMSVDRAVLRELPDAVKEMSRLLTDMPEIRAPLDVEWKMTTTAWSKAKEYKP